jgi:hypothetical protein
MTKDRDDMRRALLAGVTAVAITSVFGEPSLAACPEDIEAFEQRYQQAVGMADRETVLTDAEKADLSSLRTARASSRTPATPTPAPR